ncbi:MAG TPA: VTT domain-containing protein [Nitrososphaeraceae archaeon]|nr:VTT domain-containing protein [Nitrososphaeraceae archaeon]
MVNIDEIFAFYDDFGYLGILLISFVGSIIVFIPIPYFPVLVTAAFNKQLDPHILALSSAIGAVIAKMIIFYVSYYGRNILSTTTKRRILPLQRLLRKYGWPGAFAAALTPIPDDLIYIPLGLVKYNPWKFAIATFLGKFVLNEIIVLGAVFLGRPFIENLGSKSTDPGYLLAGAVASAIVLGIMIYLYVKIDWAKIIGKWFPWTLEDDPNEK